MLYDLLLQSSATCSMTPAAGTLGACYIGGHMCTHHIQLVGTMCCAHQMQCSKVPFLIQPLPGRCHAAVSPEGTGGLTFLFVRVCTQLSQVSPCALTPPSWTRTCIATCMSCNVHAVGCLHCSWCIMLHVPEQPKLDTCSKMSAVLEVT